SRRRHTRFSRDWSSDVCSSDLCVSSADTESFFQKSILHMAFYLLIGIGVWNIIQVATENGGEAAITNNIFYHIGLNASMFDSYRQFGKNIASVFNNISSYTLKFFYFGKVFLAKLIRLQMGSIYPNGIIPYFNIYENQKFG